MYGHKRVRERRNDALTRVGWEQLELLLATWYRGQGYEVEHTGTAASGSKYDGGIDLKLRRPGEYVLVQIKHWNAYKVPHNDVHQLLGVMVNEGATGAIVITSGEFTKAAIEAATRYGHVRLIDGNELRAMLGPLPEPALPQAQLPKGRGKEDNLTWFLFRSVFALVVVFFVLTAVNRALHSVASALRHPAGMSAARQTSVSSPTAALPPMPDVPQQNPCHEMIDKPSGTYIDHCTTVSAPKTHTAAELRESKRKADDAMRVLAPNTPEM